MPRSNRKRLMCSLGAVFLVFSFAPTLRAEVLEADGQRNWYRGNMHTHSHWSDGDDYLEMIGQWYRDHDYQFLVFTDHNVLANTERWVSVERSKGGIEAYEKLKAKFPELYRQRLAEDGTMEVRLSTFEEVSQVLNQPGEFLLVQGEEISDSFEGKPLHLNAHNLAEVIQPMRGSSVLETLQNNVRAVRAQRERTGQPMIIHINHPNFGYAITAEELMLVRGERFFEVYNGHPAVYNEGDKHHAGTERMWDIILTHRIAELGMPTMFGVGTDDGHNYHDHAHHKSNPGRGWVVVLAEDLSAESLIGALEAGQFYASSGVALQRIVSSPKEFTVEVKPVKGETYTIEFLGTRAGYDTTSHAVVDDEGKEIRTTRNYSSDLGEIFKTVEGTSATYKPQGDELYVRARVTSTGSLDNPPVKGEKKRAWCQPVVVKGSN